MNYYFKKKSVLFPSFYLRQKLPVFTPILKKKKSLRLFAGKLISCVLFFFKVMEILYEPLSADPYTAE